MRASHIDSGFRAAVVFTALSLSTGCIQWFSGDVADGVGRLTVRSVAAIAVLANNDATCGFASDAVLLNPRIEGKAGGEGAAILTVSDCVIEVEDHVLSEDCDGVQTIVSGRLTISAERRVEGRLTGDTEMPVVPSHADAVTVTIERAALEQFVVKTSASDAFLAIKSGSLSATVSPRMALSASLGVCSVATSNTAFRNIRYQDAELHVSNAGMEFDVDVPSSDVSAQAGVGPLGENAIQGSVTVWDSNETVPGDGDGLDPEYDAASFAGSFSCTDDLRLPISSACDPTQMLGHNAARVSIRNFAVLAGELQADTRCGFSSQSAIDNIEMVGTVGRPDGQAIYRARECTIDFPVVTQVTEYCDGSTVSVKGRAKVVSGTMTVTGHLTGDPDQPIVPSSREPARIELVAEIDTWETFASTSDNSLLYRGGTIAGTLLPQMAVDTSLGACAITTTVATFQGIEMRGIDATLHAGTMAFDLHLDRSALSSVTGNRGDLENYLQGELYADGQHVAIPEDDTALDPAYDREAFFNLYACKENIYIPSSDAECDFDKSLATNASRLLVKTIGSIMGVADGDETCGYHAIDRMIPADFTDHGDGTGTARWVIQDCVLGDATHMKLVDEDCKGKQTYFSGTATVTGTKTVTGELTAAYPPIQPLHRRAVRFDVQEIHLRDFAVIDYAAGSDAPQPYLVIHDAVMRGVLVPVTGEAIAHPRRYYIATPVLEFRGVELVSAAVTLHYGDGLFDFTLSQADLDAFNGEYQGSSNSLSGSIRFEGDRYDVPGNDYDPGLDPKYDAAAFAASYACKPNLLEPIPAQE